MIKVPEQVVDKMLTYLYLTDKKSECCYPYDCMHHEQCGDDDGSGGAVYCGLCTDIQEVNRMIPQKYQRADVWEYARRVKRNEIQDIYRDREDHAKMLESVGDYRAAARLRGDEEFV